MNTNLAPHQSLPFELGDLAAFAGLALIPLFPTVQPELEYIGLDEAAARGLVVTEVDHGGDVNLLQIENPLPVHVLIYEGEALAGAKQNRIVRFSTLLAPGRKVPVPVDCVERGRWAYRGRTLAPTMHAAYPALRSERHRGGDQRAVWQNVADKSARLGVQSPTEAQDALFVEHASTVEEYLEALPRVAGQTGAVVAVGGQVVCLDYVGRAEVFAGLYGKLLRGYALDALESRLQKPVSIKDVERFVASIDRGSVRLAASTGVGSDGRLAGNVRGQELSAFGELVALSAYPA